MASDFQKSIKSLLKNSILLIVIVLLFSCTVTTSKSSHAAQFIPLTNWQYRLGDSPIDKSGNFSWLRDSLKSKKWKSINSFDKLPRKSGFRSIWIRTLLPDYNFTNAAIYLGQVNEHFQVFLNNKLIYQLGDFSSTNNLKFLGWHQNLVPIYKHKKGDILTLRIWSGGSRIGPAGHVLIGNAENFYRELFFHNAVDLIFASIFLFIGIASIIIYFFFQKTKLIFAISLFLIPVSIFIAVNTSFLQMIVNAPTILYQLDHFSLYVATVGGFYVLELIVVKKYKIIIRVIWLIQLACLTVDLFSNLIWGVTDPSWFVYFLSLLALNMVISIIVLMFSVRRGGIENKILLSGMMIFFISAILEVFLFFDKTGGNYFGYSVRAIHFGVFFYVISLISILAYNYIKANKEKDIARKKVIEATQRESKAQSEFSSKLIESQEQERKRIAGELHDSIGQDLLIAKNLLLINKEKRFTNEDEIPQMLSKTIREISEISHNLRPSELDELGLTMAVESMVDRIQEASGIKFKLNFDNIDNAVDGENGINLFRIIQEALNNIVKHSEATEVAINSKIKNDAFTLQIHDNGKGFNESNNCSDSRPHFGLSGMKERIRLLKGQLNIFSDNNNGTTITLSIPIKEND